MNDDIKLIIDRLIAKQETIELYESYYHGRAPQPFLAERLKPIFKRLDTKDMRLNMCAPVIDACADRITLEGLRIGDDPDDAKQQALDDLLLDTDLVLEGDDAHKYALVSGQAYIIIWRNDATEDEEAYVEAFFNPAHLCEIIYEDDNPNAPRVAGKWWCDDEGRTRLNLYYVDHIEKWITTKKMVDAGIMQISRFKKAEWQQLDEYPNPWGMITVFELRPNRRLVQSDLHDVIPIDKGINLHFINSLVSGEFNAYRQKYVISDMDIASGVLRSSPDSVMSIPAGDGMGQATTVGEFSETNMGNYHESINNLVAMVAAVSRTPMHAFFQQGSFPSGESLIAMEAPLNKKAQDRIDRFKPVWRKIGLLLLRFAGYNDVKERDIIPLFMRPETQTPKTAAEIRKINADAGIPIEASLEMEGQPQAVIDRVIELKAEASQKSTDNLRNAFNAGLVGTGEQLPPNGATTQQKGAQTATGGAT